MDIFVLKPFIVGKLGLFSRMQNDALMYREGLKGFIIYVYKYVILQVLAS